MKSALLLSVAWMTWPAHAAPPEDAGAVAQAIRTIEKLGGSVRRDKSRPGRPVVAVELPGCPLSDDFLKIAQRFPHLEWLDL